MARRTQAVSEALSEEGAALVPSTRYAQFCCGL
jgi:hypothetical protein